MYYSFMTNTRREKKKRGETHLYIQKTICICGRSESILLLPVLILPHLPDSSHLVPLMSPPHTYSSHGFSLIPSGISYGFDDVRLFIVVAGPPYIDLDLFLSCLGKNVFGNGEDF